MAGLHTERTIASLVQSHKGIMKTAKHEPDRGNETKPR